MDEESGGGTSDQEVCSWQTQASSAPVGQQGPP